MTIRAADASTVFDHIGRKSETTLRITGLQQPRAGFSAFAADELD